MDATVATAFATSIANLCPKAGDPSCLYDIVFYGSADDGSQWEIGAHRVILAAQDTGVRFREICEDAATRILVPGVAHVGGMEVVLRYCYTRQLEIASVDVGIAALFAASFFGYERGKQWSIGGRSR
jgi:hypothetical protein